MLIFRRLLGFLNPYKRAVAWSFALAGGAMGATVLIPYLTGRAIDSISKGHRHDLVIWALAIVVAGLARLGLSAARRLVAGRVSLDVEVDLRGHLYGALQSLELAFFDRQQTGQLMSRATVDLQSVRFFLGYGLIFIAQSIFTILLAGVAMLTINPVLALIAMAPVPFVIVLSQRYGRTARPAIQEVQQRIAELTADAEDNISGVRVVKSFAREPHQLERFRHSVARVFDQSMVATRLEA
ncbi:MAG: ABC transporter transmembrane domain-containing protein, partial [Solirubrobacteraceae bacterium]